jgi:multidrug efflux pump subunit AcrB
VLCAVFVPLAFISGLTGQFYKQFALTIAISTVISAINSLTLSPALYFGSTYVNDFNLFGRTYHVTAQADLPFRKEVEDRSGATAHPQRRKATW